ncbi:MAG: mechanosensitive ion channel [Proteobacteria bacterium]|nr:mechanosensitive ion channel [Pseudomonadota bacterium]
MSSLARTAGAILLALVIAVGYGLWATRALPPGGALSVAGTPAGFPHIDQDTLFTVERLARQVTLPEELPLSQRAIELADHELDLAFTGVLRHLEADPPELSGEARAIQEKLTQAQKQLDADNATVKRLTQTLAAAADADKPALQDQLDLAQAQVDLDEYAVEQADESLLQAGGNVHQRIQAMQRQIEAGDKNRPAAALAPDPLASAQGVVGRTRQWLALRERREAVESARADVARSVVQLSTSRGQIAADLAAARASLKEGAVATGADRLALTRKITAQERRLTARDQRIDARRRLVSTYDQWLQVLRAHTRALLHQALLAAGIIIGALLLLLFVDGWIGRLLERTHVDRRQLGTLRSVISVVLQVVAVLLILLMLIGVPGQLGTILGLAGAGLTVALKDFIVAFMGWFTLMGRNGMRVGDWVEINGVSGEVVELGLFQTVLLETGNWADAGHPTGRHVTFTNSFAIEGHYFNFSTTGQWLWDEVRVVVPYDRDPHAVADAILKEVATATADSTAQAEQEWRRASRGPRDATFSAKPGVSVRPAVGGVEIAVRYVTRAGERYAVRSLLYQTAVQILSTSPVHAAP